MAGLVIDIFLVFLFKCVVRSVHFFGSSDWKRSTAFVKNWAVLDPIWGCPSVKVRYVLEGSSIESQDEIPFLFRGSARQYAERFSHTFPVTVRINPKNPDERRFFDEDQTSR